MKKRLSEVMEKVDFIQKPIELAQSSQYFIESLWEIVTEVSKLYPPLISVFSYFFGFLVNTISYQSSLYRSIQEFTLTRFEPLFPYNLEAEEVTLRGGEYFPAQTGKLAMPFLLNLSVVRAVSKAAVPLAKKPAKLAPFPKPQEPEITGKVFEKQLAEAPQETIIQRIAEVQTQLWSRLTPSMTKLSSTLTEYERQAIPITFLAAASKPVVLGRTVFAGLTPYRFVTPLEEEKVKSAYPERLPPIEEQKEKTSYPQHLVTPIEEERIKPSYPKRLGTRLEKEKTSYPERFITPLEEEKGKPEYPESLVTPIEEEKEKTGFPEPQSKEVPGEPPLDKALMAEAAPSELTGGIPLSLGTLRVVGYATKLPTAISEKQTPFLTSVTPISRGSPSPPATSLSIETSPHYAGTMPETPTPIPPSQINLLLKKISTAFTSWIREGSATLRDSRVSLSALPIAASAAEKLLAETLMQPVSSLEAPPTYEDREPISSLPPTKFKPEERHAPVEAFRLPSILTSRMAYYTQTYPWLPTEPAVNQTYETPFEVEQLTSEKPTTPSEISETQEPSKPPITFALAATETLITQRRQQESAAFMKKIQISKSTYAKAVADLGAAGPIRTTMLDELAVGLTIPYTPEPYTPYTPHAETPFPYTTEPYPTPQRPVSPQLPGQVTTSPKAIKINVFADTDKEDLRDLERKISRILSEQVADLGAAGPIRTTMLDELAVGLSIPYTLETYTPHAEAVSQQPLIQSAISPTSQDTINVNVFADTAEEDLRDLERKIRRILSEQISRYYGSSRI